MREMHWIKGLAAIFIAIYVQYWFGYVNDDKFEKM